MRTAISSLELARPRSLAEALALLNDEPSIVPLAGCTDLYVLLNAGTLPGTRYLDLWPLDELRGIQDERTVLRLGALTTFSDLIHSPVAHRRVPGLVAAAREVGAVQIQNRGTLGGNIANASPAGDSLPMLAALEADVLLSSVDGTRRVPFTSFYTGYRASVMRRGEIITAVEIPRVTGKQWFRKVGTRAAQAISKIVMAGVRTSRPRIAFGSVAPTVVRVPRTEELLAAGGSLEEATAMLATEIHPIDDIRSTAEYRRRVAGNLLAAFWQQTA